MDNQDAETADEAKEPMLNSTEARVLSALMEKQKTTPDNYPLTLNALVQACNQKTSRSPIMSLEQGQVGHTVNQLRDRDLIATSFTGRAQRYDQRLAKTLQLDQMEQAALCVLMLRGAKTVGELRTNASRMAEFSDLASVQDTLELLAASEPPLVKKIPPTTGRREERYVHLLCGEVELEQNTLSTNVASEPATDRIADLEQEIGRLKRELKALWSLTGLEDRRLDHGDE